MISSVEYLKKNNLVKAYVVVNETTTAVAELNSRIYVETSNKKEPFDYNLHTFEFNESELVSAGEFTIRLKTKNYWPDKPLKPIEEHSFKIKFDQSKVLTEKEAVFRSVRSLKFNKTEACGNLSGLCWKQELYITADNLPVRVYTSVADLNKTEIIAGTPNAEPVFTPLVIQTVLDEAKALETKSKTVLCAINADFFDIFGDCRPSGLCISKGKIIVNPNAENAFFGIKTNGMPVITYQYETDLKEIKEAVSGKQVIVKDCRVAETAPLQPFGETHHPRTAVGITLDNKVILMVVDGNNLQWSNGASLTELALLMIEKGAKIALNLDGGGSSTFVIRDNDSLLMKNKPSGRVIVSKEGRQLFNSLIVVAKHKATCDKVTVSLL